MAMARSLVGDSVHGFEVHRSSGVFCGWSVTTVTLSGDDSDAHITVSGRAMMKSQHRCAFVTNLLTEMHRHDPIMRLLAARVQPKGWCSARVLHHASANLEERGAV